ncbi:MAG: sulfotransferase [Xanthomonadaceae bacterium]|nr:sulfotransferase [Xanthomonadaceae bacterium]
MTPSTASPATGIAPKTETLRAPRQSSARGQADATGLLGALHGADEDGWLECAQALVLRGDHEMALLVLDHAMAAHPRSARIRLALGGSLLHHGNEPAAETVLRALLCDVPEHAACSLLLAGMLKEQGRMKAAATTVVDTFARKRQDVESLLLAIELLDDAGHQQEAATLCEAEIAAGSGDARLFAHAGMLLSQLGKFEQARVYQESALAMTAQALDWHVPLGMAGLQRYRQPDHPDLSLFAGYLQQSGLGSWARAGLLFALGKARDDLGDYAQAAALLREANALVNAMTRWPRKQWRRSIEARLKRKPPAGRLVSPMDWIPVFIVGLPRAGTTLLAELLGRHPAVRHRGELPWMPTLADQLATAGDRDDGALERAAGAYAAQLRQDDGGAGWLIDKQPHNFMHVDLILAMFPNARIIHCQRNARDNALSLWMQSFQAGKQGFAYDFTDIAAVIHGSRRLMQHWRLRYPDSIRAVRYEALIADPASVLDALCTWLTLPFHNLVDAHPEDGAISTASLWQARQPIHSGSIQRWKHYAVLLPELLSLPDI